MQRRENSFTNLRRVASYRYESRCSLTYAFANVHTRPPERTNLSVVAEHVDRERRFKISAFIGELYGKYCVFIKYYKTRSAVESRVIYKCLYLY